MELSAEMLAVAGLVIVVAAFANIPLKPTPATRARANTIDDIFFNICVLLMLVVILPPLHWVR